MVFPDEIKKIRQQLLMTQEDFAKEIGVSFSTVNRWEGGKVKPNMSAMKRLKEFCETHEVDFAVAKEEWLKYKVGEK